MMIPRDTNTNEVDYAIFNMDMIITDFFFIKTFFFFGY